MRLNSNDTNQNKSEDNNLTEDQEREFLKLFGQKKRSRSRSKDKKKKDKKIKKDKKHKKEKKDKKHKKHRSRSFESNSETIRNKRKYSRSTASRDYKLRTNHRTNGH